MQIAGIFVGSDVYHTEVVTNLGIFVAAADANQCIVLGGKPQSILCPTSICKAVPQ